MFIHFMINYVRTNSNIIFILLRFNINSIEFIYSSCFPCLCPWLLKLDFGVVSHFLGLFASFSIFFSPIYLVKLVFKNYSLRLLLDV